MPKNESFSLPMSLQPHIRDRKQGKSIAFRSGGLYILKLQLFWHNLQEFFSDDRLSILLFHYDFLEGEWEVWKAIRFE